MINKPSVQLQDNFARDYPFSLPLNKASPQPQKKRQTESTARESAVPNRPMKIVSEDLTESELTVCSTRTWRECNRNGKERRLNTIKREANHQSMPINSRKGSLSLNSAENQPNHKAVQAEINVMNVSDSVHCFRDTNDLRVREEIDIFEKQISSKFSDVVRHNDENILKFDEKLKTPSSAVIENYLNVTPKEKSEICSDIENISQQNSKNRIVKPSDRKFEIEDTVLTFEEKCFQTLQSQESEITFETNHIVFEEPCVLCNQVSVESEISRALTPTKETYTECSEDDQLALLSDSSISLQKVSYNSLIYSSDVEKGTDFVEDGVCTEAPPYTCKLPRKRKPPDRASNTNRRLS